MAPIVSRLLGQLAAAGDGRRCRYGWSCEVGL